MHMLITEPLDSCSYFFLFGDSNPTGRDTGQPQTRQFCHHHYNDLQLQGVRNTHDETQSKVSESLLFLPLHLLMENYVFTATITKQGHIGNFIPVSVKYSCRDLIATSSKTIHGEWTTVVAYE